MEPIVLLVRRTPKHACVAHVQKTHLGYSLLRVTVDSGPVPDVKGLTFNPELFKTRKALRKAIVERMVTAATTAVE